MIGVEVRRLLARRLVRALGAVLAIGIVVAPPLVDWAFRERARIERDADVEDCVEAGQGERRCEAITPERDPDFHLDELAELLRPLGALLAIGAFVVGASAVGADWQTGFLATLLTWEPNRVRVAIGKLAALVVVVGAAVAVWQLLLAGVLAPFAERDALAGEWASTTVGLGARITVVAAGSAVLGAAIALVGRGTAAALGGGLAYALVFERVLSSSFKPLRPWLVLDNSLVFVSGRFEAGGDVPGRTMTAAAVILSSYLAVALVAAVLWFRQRDVS